MKRRFFLLLLGAACTSPLLAQPLPFAGHWVLDEAAQPQVRAGHTRLTVKEGRMTWSGPDKATPACVQDFVLKPEKPGTVYTDVRGTKYVAGTPGSLPTYLLKLTSNSCGGIDEDLRIRYPLVYDTQRIDVIEYAQGRPVSARRLRRAPQAAGKRHK